MLTRRSRRDPLAGPGRYFLLLLLVTLAAVSVIAAATWILAFGWPTLWIPASALFGVLP